MYRNVLECTPNGPSTLASASLVITLKYKCSLVHHPLNTKSIFITLAYN